MPPGASRSANAVSAARWSPRWCRLRLAHSRSTGYSTWSSTSGSSPVTVSKRSATPRRTARARARWSRGAAASTATTRAPGNASANRQATTPGPLPASTISPGSVTSRASHAMARSYTGANSSACVSSRGPSSLQSMSVPWCPCP
ncbi:hypothetical protein SCANM63S_07298 [Streptomyces canarius]